jgi:hypothetical protein
MNAIEVIDEIQSAVEDVKQQGRKTIRVTALEKYLVQLKSEMASATLATTTELAKTTHDFTLAQYNTEWEANLAQFNAEHEIGLEHAKVVSQTGHLALKSAILINGGASVALLAFLGKLYEGAPASKVLATNMSHALLPFVSGVLFSASAAGLSYLAAYFGREETKGKFRKFNSLAIVFVIVSYIAFAVGGLLGYLAFGTSKP